MKENRYKAVRDDIHSAILRGIDFSRSVEDAEVLSLIDEEIIRAKRQDELTLDEMKHMRRELFNAIRRLDVLQELIEDPSVTEIMINGPDHIFIEQAGKLRRTERAFVSKEKLEDVVQFYLETTYHYFAYHYLPQKALFYAENNDKYAFSALIQ